MRHDFTRKARGVSSARRFGSKTSTVERAPQPGDARRASARPSGTPRGPRRPFSFSASFSPRRSVGDRGAPGLSARRRAASRSRADLGFGLVADEPARQDRLGERVEAPRRLDGAARRRERSRRQHAARASGRGSDHAKRRSRLSARRMPRDEVIEPADRRVERRARVGQRRGGSAERRAGDSGPPPATTTTRRGAASRRRASDADAAAARGVERAAAALLEARAARARRAELRDALQRAQGQRRRVRVTRSDARMVCEAAFASAGGGALRDVVLRPRPARHARRRRRALGPRRARAPPRRGARRALGRRDETDASAADRARARAQGLADAPQVGGVLAQAERARTPAPGASRPQTRALRRRFPPRRAPRRRLRGARAARARPPTRRARRPRSPRVFA